MSFKPEFKNLRAHRDWNLFLLRDKNNGPSVERVFIQTVPYSGAGFEPPASTVLVPVRNEFVSLLSSFGTATFEEQTVLQFPLLSVNGAVTGDITGNVNIVAGPIIDPEFPPELTVDNRNVNGRFNTTPSGSKFVELSNGVEVQDEATLTPSVNKTAIGFYLSDIADFSNTLTITVNTSNGSLIYVIPNPNPVAPVTFAMFFAFCLVDRTVINVNLKWTNTNDIIGIDDIIIGDYP